MVKELGIGILMPLFQIGSLPHDLATKSANLFATEVLPYIRTEVERARGGKPTVSMGAQRLRPLGDASDVSGTHKCKLPPGASRFCR